MSRANRTPPLATTPEGVSTPGLPLGAVYGRTFPAAGAAEFAQRLEGSGAAEFWVIEDCFFTSAPTLAASALTRTDRLRVGIGIVPAVSRAAAVTAMEFATLAGLGPGRLIGGIGHGVAEWMAQLGVLPGSPLTALEETLVAVRRLMAGERVSVTGRYVELDHVQLDQPPSPVPRVLAGVRGPRSMAMAGRCADGVLLAEPAAATYVRWAREAAGAGPDFPVHVFTVFGVDSDQAAARRMWSGFLGARIEEAAVGMTVLPFFDELRERWGTGGAAALETAPQEWWHELMAVGTPEDVSEHLSRLAAAGVAGTAFILSPDLAVAHGQLADIESLLRRRNGTVH